MFVETPLLPQRHWAHEPRGLPFLTLDTSCQGDDALLWYDGRKTESLQVWKGFLFFPAEKMDANGATAAPSVCQVV